MASGMEALCNGMPSLSLDDPPPVAGAVERTKKPRTRRKPRRKGRGDPSCESEQSHEPPKVANGNFVPTIKNVESPKALFVRKRNESKGKIRLGSYVEDGKTPCEFRTTRPGLGKAEGGQRRRKFQQNDQVVRNDVVDFRQSERTMSSADPPSNPYFTRNQARALEAQYAKKQLPKAPKAAEPVAETPKPKKNRQRHRKRESESADNRLQQQQQQHPQKYEPYMTSEEVDAGVRDGTLVVGELRINPRFRTEAYVSNVDRSKQDYLIGSVAERNRALEGDVVVLKILPEDEKKVRAKVVRILEKVHLREAIGYLGVVLEKGKHLPTFTPRDRRFPLLRLDPLSVPCDLLKRPDKYSDVLFLAKILAWETPRYAIGVVTDCLGVSKDLRNETLALLLEHNVDRKPFPEKFAVYLPKSTDITDDELRYRRDFRRDCIFTIDPLTARDLDDAVSCRRLENGNYEVGVHIADVAHYLAEGTPLDDAVCKRATSTYLVDNVYHMLPPELCMHCSLLPGHDKLAFSAILELTPEADVVRTDFARSIIHSCAQLAYEHAQHFIEDPDSYPPDMPDIQNGFDPEQIRTAVLTLHALAVQLRRRRQQNGALRIDQVKLGFVLDGRGTPESFYKQEQREANRMIEEFMLLANASVAKRVHDDFGPLAFLRCHDEPNQRLLGGTQTMLESVGIHLNITSSKSLHESLVKYNVDDRLGVARFMALNHLLAKSMNRAEYFCVGDRTPDTFWHYALSIPIYTHFTSPIRRYADVMVHRLLSAGLGYTKRPNWDPTWASAVADNCNKRKYNAKKAGEASCDLYLAHYVEERQPYLSDAVVVYVQEKAFDAVTLDTGSCVRVYANAFDEGVTCESVSYGDDDDKDMYRMFVRHPASDGQPPFEQVIEIFQLVRVRLVRREKTNKLDAFLVRPEQNRAAADPL